MKTNDRGSIPTEPFDKDNIRAVDGMPKLFITSVSSSPEIDAAIQSMNYLTGNLCQRKSDAIVLSEEGVLGLMAIARRVEREKIALQNKLNKELMDNCKLLGDIRHYIEVEIPRLRLAMEACASIAGQYWLVCKLALGQALDNKPGEELEWVLAEYERMKARDREADT